MFLMSIALGGCLKGPPVRYGLTEDTGGHIAYVLGAALALGRREDVDQVEIVTRLIEDSRFGPDYAQPHERIAPKVNIRRIDNGNRRYLSKEAALSDRSAFIVALIDDLGRRQRRPDLIHAHFADAAMVAMAVRDRFAIPFVYTAHSLGMDKALASAGDTNMVDRIAEENAAIAAADAIIASSRDESERQLMLYPAARPSRVHCVPPGPTLDGGGSADPDRARRLITPFLRNPEKPIVLSIARPVLKKNLLGLIDLYAAHGPLRDTANLVIVAGLRDGPDSGEAEQREVIGGMLRRLDTLDLYGSLALPKKHDQADVAALYALARETGGVFANPAFTEPYGLTLIEAAQAGLPVVATCNGGAADIVRNLGHGLIADPQDGAAFADAIYTLLTDRQLWKRASASGIDAGARLTWTAYADSFMRIARPIVRAEGAPVAPERSRYLLLCDIDNTLTGCAIGVRRIAAFLHRNSDVLFGVATGRSLQEAERLLREWGLPEPRVLVTSVGTEIYWRRGGRLHADDAFAGSIAPGWEPDLVANSIAGVAGLRLQPQVEQRRFKRSYVAETSGAIASARAAVAGLQTRMICSHGDLVDLVPAGAGKGAAMEWIAEKLGIAPDHIYAAGDSGNDLDMLAKCRNAIIVANHEPALAELIRHPSVYVSRKPSAGGIVEGMYAHARRRAA